MQEPVAGNHTRSPGQAVYGRWLCQLNSESEAACKVVSA